MDGMAFTRSNEGSRAKAYKDTVGKVTVGVGFNMDAPSARLFFTVAVPDADFDAIYAGTRSLNDDQVDRLFAQSYAAARVAARRQVRGFDGLPQEVQCVVIDMTFNLGEVGFAGFVDMRDALRRGAYVRAAACMKDSAWYRQVPGRAATCAAIVTPAAYRDDSQVALARKWVGAA